MTREERIAEIQARRQQRAFRPPLTTEQKRENHQKQIAHIDRSIARMQERRSALVEALAQE
jgi:hypothetical protein